MGDWDTYCLLCSGTTNTTKIGSSKPSALEKRRRKNRQRRNGEESSDKEYYELSGDDDEDRVYDEDEDRSYDPTLVTKESSGWVLEQRCLGLNTDGDEEGGDEEDARYVSGLFLLLF